MYGYKLGQKCLENRISISSAFVSSLNIEDTNLMDSLVPDSTLQRVQVLKRFLTYRTVTKMAIPMLLQNILAQLWIECMNVHCTYLCST